MLAAVLVVVASNSYASVTENFEQTSGHTGSAKDYLITQNWQFPSFNINPEGSAPLSGSQSIGTDVSYSPNSYAGMVTPFLTFSNTEALQFSYAINRPMQLGGRRYFKVYLVDQSRNLTLIDSVEIGANQTAARIYTKIISGHAGTYAIYINVKGGGCTTNTTFDDFYFSGNNAGVNHPAKVDDAESATGISEASANASILGLYPNPASNNVNIQLASNGSQEATVEIYNVNGALVYNNLTTLTDGNNTLNLDIADYTAGNYFVTIRTADGAIAKRFVKF